MLEVEPTSQRDRKWPNGNEAVANATSEALARWQHHRYAPVELASAEHVVSPRDILLRDHTMDSSNIGWT